jgi:hypothetical protein
MRRTLINGPIVTVMAATLVILTGWLTAAPASAADRHIYLAANGATARSAAVEPREAPISGDSTLFLHDMAWTQWTDRATGTGTAELNLCDPSCAAGTMVKVPVTVTLTHPEQVCGRDFFTNLQVTLSGAVPEGLTRSTSVPIAPRC